MQIFTTIAAWQAYRATLINQTIGFVPTMGNLHQGHASLLTQSVQENAITILSLFVNPTQFNQPGDLANYPKTIEADLQLARHLNVSALFMPDYAAMYPDDYHYQVLENQLSQLLCGKYRPGHFTGVLTIVLKLLLLINPQRTYLGEKDFQQLQLIKGLVNAFFIPTTIVACPTVRDSDGLALSSRNSLLTPVQRQLATNFPRLLHSKLSIDEIKQQLNALGFVIDYIEEYQGRRFGAVKLGDVRLIDNVVVES